MTAGHRGAIISGIGISPVGRRSGIEGIDLTATSTKAAVADAGLKLEDIDGIASIGDTPLHETSATLGIEPHWRGDGINTGGLLAPVMAACRAVRSRSARHVLVYRTVQMMGGTILPQSGAPGSGAPATPDAAPAIGVEWIGPLLTMHAYSAANWVAMHCRRHMFVYGTTKEQLGWLAVNTRRNAALNPLAAYRQPMTMDDYLGARMISDPLGLYDCDVPVDGSIALVISAAEFARDTKQHAVAIESTGAGSGEGGWDDRPDYPKMASIEAAAEMWSRTSLTPKDIDVAELYDGFTFLTLAWLEALGICRDGEAGPFVEGAHRIALDGELPLNTYGGQLSAGRMHGYWVLYEAVLQLRHQAGARQVADAQVAAVAAGGGPIAGCMLLTR